MEKDITLLNGLVTKLKEEYTNMQNEVNYYYWPLDAELAKKKKDYTWYFLISLCLLVASILSVLCNIVRNEYLIGIVLGLSVLLVAFTFFITYKVNKKKNALKVEWNKALEPALKKKEELNETMEKARVSMIEVLKKEDKEISDDDSYEEVYELYDSYINSL